MINETYSTLAHNICNILNIFVFLSELDNDCVALRLSNKLIRKIEREQPNDSFSFRIIVDIGTIGTKK